MKGKELRYELTEKYTAEKLAENEEETINRVWVGLDAKGIDISASTIRRRIAKEEAKVRGEELEDNPDRFRTGDGLPGRISTR